MKRTRLIALLPALALVLTACNSAPAATTSASGKSAPAGTPASPQKSAPADRPAQMTKIKIAWSVTALDYLPWYVAIDKGIFEKYNLQVEGLKTDGGVTAVRAMVAGELQFVGVLPEIPITARDQGAAVKVIGALNNKPTFALVVTPDIKTAQDFKGKRIAINSFATGVDFQVRYYLEANGLKPMKDVEIIQAGDQPARLAAMKSGQAAGTLLSPPTNKAAEAEGYKTLVKMSDHLKTYNHEVIVTTEKLMKEQPEVVTAFMKATSEAIVWLRANKAESVEIGAKWTKSGKDLAEYGYDYLLPTFPTGGKLDRDGVAWTLNAVQEAGGAKKSLKAEDVFDYSFEQ